MKNYLNTPALMLSFRRLAITRSQALKPALAAAVLLAAALGGNAQAQTWTGATSGDWGTDSNWSGGVPGNGSNPTFGATTGATAITFDDQAVFYYGLTFSAGASSYTINPSGGSYYLNATAPIVSDASVTETFNVPILLYDSAGGTFDANGSGNLVIGGIGDYNAGVGVNISGTGSGAVVLTGVNTYTGDTVMNSGQHTVNQTLQLANANALQNSALTINASNDSGGSTQTLQLRGNGNTTFNIGSSGESGIAANIDLFNFNYNNGNFAFDAGATAGGSAGVMSVGTVTWENSPTLGTSPTLNATNSNGDGSGLAIGAIVSNNSNISGVAFSNILTINSSITNANGFTIGSFTGANNIASTLTLTGAGNTTFTGAVANGTGQSLSLNVNQTGSVTLQGSDSFNGGAITQAAGSILQLTNANALSGGALTLNGGSGTTTLQLRGTGNTTFAGGTQNTNGQTNNILLVNSQTSQVSSTFVVDVGSTNSTADTMTIGALAYEGYYDFNGHDSVPTLSVTNSTGDGSGLTIGSITGAGNGATPPSNFFAINSSVSNLTIGSYTGDTANAGSLTVTGTGNTTFTGAISNGAGLSLTKAGTGALTLQGNSGYSSGTTISGGTLYVNNTSGSGTGSGAVTVKAGGTLAGSGTISGAVTVQSGGTLASGPAQTGKQTTLGGPGSDTVSGPGLTADLAVNGGATLQFALGAGASTGYLNYDSPNLNSTYLTSTGPVTFGTTGGDVNITLVDLTAFSLTDTLQLRTQNPYLLITASGGLDSSYNLVTTGGYDQNGLVLGIGSSGTGTSVLNSFNVTAQDVNGNALTAPYSNLQLYLENGNLEVIPEPGTWALMVGGLALLVVIQRRRRDSSL